MQNNLKLPKSNKKNPSPILIASMLDWGLGHTTRSIPLIQEFDNQGFNIHIAATEKQIHFLRKELPKATYHFIRGYDIHYSKRKIWFPFTIFMQLPKILRTIYQEHYWLKQFIKKHPAAVILSDNRPGFYHKSVPSVYITHQLSVLTGNNLSSKIATYLHRKCIRNFSVCWVPDTQDHVLAGILSTFDNASFPIKYIGPMTRLKLLTETKKYDVAVILSGPEPQRSILEKQLIRELSGTALKTIVVRGIQNEQPMSNQENIQFINYLNTDELNGLIAQSELIISRSGYTTIMDLCKLRAKALLIPTPGQTEQEYLSAFLSEKGYFFKANQSNAELLPSIQKALISDSTFPEIDFDTYIAIIDKLAEEINNKQQKV